MRLGWNVCHYFWLFQGCDYWRNVGTRKFNSQSHRSRSPFTEKPLVSVNGFKFWNLFFSLVRHKDQELIQSGPEVCFFSCSAEIVLKFYHWIIFRPQNQMGNLPVRHTVMKQLETTLIQRLDVDSTSRRWFNVGWNLGSTLCAWLACSFCSQTLPLMLNFKLWRVNYHYFLFIYYYYYFWFTRLDGLYPQAYDLISIFSIFMEVSNIWLCLV